MADEKTSTQPLAGKAPNVAAAANVKAAEPQGAPLNEGATRMTPEKAGAELKKLDEADSVKTDSRPKKAVAPSAKINGVASVLVDGKDQHFRRGEEAQLAAVLEVRTYLELANKGVLVGDWGYQRG